jgi:hypothetical protein
MKAFLLTFIGLSLIFVGCGRSADGGEIPASANTAADAMGRAVTQYGGEWSRVPEKDRQVIVAHFGGDQGMAEAAIRSASLAPKPPMPGQAPSQFMPR